jgi:hypothetical protein
MESWALDKETCVDEFFISHRRDKGRDKSKRQIVPTTSEVARSTIALLENWRSARDGDPVFCPPCPRTVRSIVLAGKCW